VSDKDTPQPPSPSDLTERGGYQGTHDPGQPVNLMQPQINSTGQTGAQPAGNAPSQGAANQGGSAGATAQDSSSD
jgi:hypothetical protein